LHVKIKVTVEIVKYIKKLTSYLVEVLLQLFIRKINTKLLKTAKSKLILVWVYLPWSKVYLIGKDTPMTLFNRSLIHYLEKRDQFSIITIRNFLL